VPVWQAKIDQWPMDLNVGALGGKPGARQLDNTTYLLDQEITAIESLTEMGVKVYFQIVPNSARQEWKNLRSKFLKS
jgi:mannose/fructose/N-acetylgalactosamine-specific phosphotransferase system component IIB